MNHNIQSLTTHQYNFPQAQHRIEDLADLDPCAPPHPLMSWWSPECRFLTPARGEKIKGAGQLPLWHCGELDPRAERSRMLMNHVGEWASAKYDLGVPYQTIFVENVEEVHLWSGFSAWLKGMLDIGNGYYTYRALHLNSQIFGVPQSRDRVYFVFWPTRNRAPKLDFLPQGECVRCAKRVCGLQCWKNPRRPWGKYHRQYSYRCEYCLREIRPEYTPAESIIDWGKPAPTIGERKRPLTGSTMERIKQGVAWFGRASQASFLVSYYRNGKPYSPALPLCTVSTKPRNGLCLPPESGSTLTDLSAWRYRMLDRYEVQAAMGFDPDYQIVASSEGEAIRQLGLAVTPIVAEHLVHAALEALA